MNTPGDPRSYHRWSVWRPKDSLGFTENVSDWKRSDDSTDALISNVHCALVKCGPRLTHLTIFDWLHGLSRLLIGGLPRTETDHPTINHKGGPLGEPGFCIFCSTESAIDFASFFDMPTNDTTLIADISLCFISTQVSSTCLVHIIYPVTRNHTFFLQRFFI